MTYKILLPVTTSPDLVSQKLVDLKDHMNNLIVVNNWTNSKVHNLCKDFATKGAEVWDCRYNLGLAATWNHGLKRMVDDDSDFLLVLAPSAIFSKEISYFLDEIYLLESKNQLCRYILSPNCFLHAFVQTKLSVTMGGYFDENFWPIYYEDTDYCYRSKFNGIEKRVELLKLDGVKSFQASISCNADSKLMGLHQMNCKRWMNYYTKKWGGNQGSEQFKTPFNDPNKNINFWVKEGGFYHPGYPGNWMPPLPEKRY